MRRVPPGAVAAYGAGALALAAATAPVQAAAQQVADTAFTPEVTAPAFPAGTGPVVLVDEAHHNFHTVDGRYAPFARLLRADGYRVDALTEAAGPASLAGADVLVVANAVHERNIEDWTLPTPSAFTPAEIDAIRRWVEEGGALLLIADHMPFPGAAADLAAAFGFRLANGFARDTLAACVQCPMPFRRGGAAEGSGGGTLAAHAITDGTVSGARVDSVVTFTGQAFEAPDDAEPLLVLGPGGVQLLPDEAWVFDDDTRRESAAGWLQGAVRRVGAGRVAVFGEAAQFTAQRAGPDGSVRMGMNAPEAADNPQFLLNVLRWLTAGRDG